MLVKPIGFMGVHLSGNGKTLSGPANRPAMAITQSRQRAWGTMLSRFGAGYARPLMRFGSGDSGFELSAYLAKETVPRIEETFKQARAVSTGETVTPEDYLLAMINQFDQAYAEYQQTEDKRYFEGVGYLSSLVGLNANPAFADTKKLACLEEARQRLLHHGQSNTVTPDRRSGQPSPELMKLFAESRKAFANLQEQKGPHTDDLLIGEDMLMQVFAKLHKGMAGNLMREFYERIAPPHNRIDAYLSDEAKKADAVAANLTEPRNVTQKVRENQLQPYPAVAQDVDEVVKTLLFPVGTNNVLMLLPPSVQEQGMVHEIARMLEAQQSQLPQDTRRQLFQLDFMAFLQAARKQREGGENTMTAGSVVEEAFTNLRKTILELARNNSHPVVYIRNLRDILEEPKNDYPMLSYFENLMGQAPLSLLMGVSADALPHTAQGPVRPITQARWATHFQPVSIDKPSDTDINRYVTAHLDELKKTFPRLTIRQDAVETATRMALDYGTEIPKTALEFLGRAARNHSEGELTGEQVFQTITRDPYLKYTQTVARQLDFTRLSPQTIATSLEGMEGMETLKVQLNQLKTGIQKYETFERLGLKLPSRLLVHGEPGTGKTDAVLGFARDAGLPVIYIDGKKYAGASGMQVADKLEQAFVSAEKQVQRLSRKGQAPYVLVVADHLEAPAFHHKPTGQVINPLAEQLVPHLERLKQESHENILFVGITNHANGVNAGFFQNQRLNQVIHVELPYENERLALLQRFARQLEEKLGYPVYAEDINFKRAAKRLKGFTGRDISLVLEKARKAAAAASDNPDGLVHNRHLDAAITSVQMGGAENPALLKRREPRQILMTGYHEVGHALGGTVMSEILGCNFKLHKLTVMPQGNAYGVAFFYEQEELHAQTKEDLFSRLVMSVASREVEKLLGTASVGFLGDNQLAGNLAYAMAAHYAMGNNPVFVDVPYEQAPKHVQRETIRLLNVAREVANTICEAYSPFIRQMAIRLCGETGRGGIETISGEAFVRALRRFQKTHPELAVQVSQNVRQQLHQVFPEKFESDGSDKQRPLSLP